MTGAGDWILPNSLSEMFLMMCRSTSAISLLVSMQFFPNNRITLTAHIAPRRLPLSLFSLKFANLIITSTRFFSFLRFTVSFLQKRGFPLKAGGSPQFWLLRRGSNSSNTGVGNVLFLLLFLCYCFLWRPLAIFRSGIFHCGASAFLPLQSTVVVLAIFTAAISPTTSHRRFALRALSFAKFSSILSLHQTRSSRFHFSFWSSSSRRRAPSIALLDAGRGE